MPNDQKTIRNAMVDPRTANFSGIARTQNDREGTRYFLVKLTEEMADELREDGWPVRMTNKNEKYPDYVPYPYLKVFINYDTKGYRPKPSVYLVSKNNRTLLDEETIERLEGRYFEKVDITVENAYLKRYDCWAVYLTIGFFTIQPNELYDEYFKDENNIPDDEEDIPFM